MTTFWIIYQKGSPVCYKGASFLDAVDNYNRHKGYLSLRAETWEELAACGWKCCYVEDYS